MADPLNVRCSVMGCDRPHRARGLCGMHYQRAKHHDTLPPRTSNTSWEMVQFIAKALLTAGEECCLWPYPKTGAGYGELKLGGRQQLVHRFICEAAYGAPPSATYEVAHSCGVRICINPRHLRWDTRKGNHADKIIHGTVQRGERGTLAKLTDAQVLLIRSQPHKTNAALAAEFGVDSSNIGLIRRRKTWSHI